MDLHDLTAVLSAQGPFVTVHVGSESAVEQAQGAYDLEWKNVLARLAELGVDEATPDRGRGGEGQPRRGRQPVGGGHDGRRDRPGSRCRWARRRASAWSTSRRCRTCCRSWTT